MRRTKHTALVDCDLLSKVYINLIDQKEPMLNFQTQDAKTQNENSMNLSYYKKVVIPSSRIEKYSENKNLFKKIIFNLIFHYKFQNYLFFSNFTSG